MFGVQWDQRLAVRRLASNLFVKLAAGFWPAASFFMNYLFLTPLNKTMNKKNFLHCLTVTLISISITGFVGCGGSKWPKTYKSSGTVTLDGTPVERATITFYPLDGQKPANATTDANGAFELTSFNAGDGATPGSFAVAIQKFPAIEIEAVPGGVPFDESNNTDEGPAPGSEKDAESELPEKYGNREESGLSATVATDGENVFNFELTSK